MPSARKPLDDLFVLGLREAFTTALNQALSHVRDLEASVGASVAEVQAKEAAKRRLDLALAPFRMVAAAWTGGIMLGAPDCDDFAYQQLVQEVASNGTIPDSLDSEPRLLHMIALGLGTPQISGNRDCLLQLATGEITAAQSGVALPYDLAFADVFYPGGTLDRHGFDAVLGNPPWDRLLPSEKEFFAGFDLAVLDAPQRVARKELQQHLASELAKARAFDDYVSSFRAVERVAEALYRWQSVLVEGKRTIGKKDVAALFVERARDLVQVGGRFGLVVPAAIHVNEGNTGIRRMLLDTCEIQSYYCFQNKRSIFDIVTNVKFDLLTARRTHKHTSFFQVGFYLQDPSWLFDSASAPLVYSRDLVTTTSPKHLTFLEVQSPTDVNVLGVVSASGRTFEKYTAFHGMRFGRELNMTDDAHRFQATGALLGPVEDPRDGGVLSRLTSCGRIVVCEDDSIHQYTDHWTERPSFLTSTLLLQDRPSWIEPCRHYRLFFRRIATIVDARSMMAAVVPPGWISASPQASRRAGLYPVAQELLLASILNSYTFDWSLRLRLTATVNLFLVESCTIPDGITPSAMALLCHGALRLSCCHDGYALLWQDQLGDTWREQKAVSMWPVLDGEDQRWFVRAAMDAVVAHAYGLSREHYAHVLSTFSHKGYPKAPTICLASYDEIGAVGLEEFTRKHDPYWDIALNDKIPQPVLELPKPSAQRTVAASGALNFEPTGETGLVRPPARTKAAKSGSAFITNKAKPHKKT